MFMNGQTHDFKKESEDFARTFSFISISFFVENSLKSVMRMRLGSI